MRIFSACLQGLAKAIKKLGQEDSDDSYSVMSLTNITESLYGAQSRAFNSLPKIATPPGGLVLR